MRELFERAEQGIGASFRDLQIILDAMPVALSWASLPGGPFTRVFGYQDKHFATVEQWINETYETAAEKKIARERWAALWKGKRTGAGEIQPLECRVRCADGTFRTTLHRGTLLLGYWNRDRDLRGYFRSEAGRGCHTANCFRASFSRARQQAGSR